MKKSFFLSLTFLILVSCEKNIETKNKDGVGREAIDVTDDIEYYGRFDKRYDSQDYEKEQEKLDRKRGDFNRQVKIEKGLEDGSLMNKYGGK